jgi:hypothetical protein
MTLNVTASEIQIKNSAGQVKFTSNNKLIWQRKPIQTGSFTITAGAVSVPFQALEKNDFLIISIIITACNGVVDGVTDLLNKEIPANGSIMIDFNGRGVATLPAADSEHLGVELIGSDLIFKTIRFNYDGSMTNGTRTTSLTYKARIWSFL